MNRQSLFRFACVFSAVTLMSAVFAAPPKEHPRPVNVAMLPSRGVPQSAEGAINMYARDTQQLQDKYTKALDERRQQLIKELTAIMGTPLSPAEQGAVTKVLKELTGDRTAVELLLKQFRAWQNDAAPRPRLRSLQHGLALFEYPRHRKQDTSEFNYYVEPSQFGTAIGSQRIVSDLYPITFHEDCNAIALGYLKIEQAGEYGFEANAGYDRNLLIINGQLVCPFRDGEHTVGRIMLDKGMIPIAYVVFFETKGRAFLKWQPPGAVELAPIPEELLFSPKRL